MASTADFKNGLIIQHKNNLWKIVDRTQLQEEEEVNVEKTQLDKNFLKIGSKLKELTNYASSLNLMTKGGQRRHEEPLQTPLIFAE